MLPSPAATSRSRAFRVRHVLTVLLILGGVLPAGHASNMGMKVRVSYSLEPDTPRVISLLAYSGYDTADDLLLDFYSGWRLELSRHDPWTDQVRTRVIERDPATGQAVLRGDEFVIEAGWGYLLQGESGVLKTLAGSHDPSLNALSLPWDPDRSNVRHVAVPWHTTWQTVDDLLLEAFRANGGLSLTAVRYIGSGVYLIRSVEPDARGEPVFSGVSFPIEEGHGLTLRLDADPGGGAALLPLPHY